MFYLLSKAVSTSAGFLYPAYSSYKAIRSNDADDIEHWLMYWVVMAGLHAVENTVEWTVNWFPFYYEAKTVAILWLTLPQIKGSTYVYVTYIHPFLLQHESEIDKKVAQTRQQARNAGLDYMRRAYVYLREALMGALMSSEAQQAANVQDVHQRTVEQPGRAQPVALTPNGTHTQHAWRMVGNVLGQYGLAAVAAGHNFLRPMGNVNVADLHATNIPRDEASRRKKYDDLGVAGAGAAGPAQRLYTQEQGGNGARPSERRIQSASAALLGATGGQASGSAYSTYTRQQLRQRRIELERELAALETTSDGPSDADSTNGPSPAVSSLRSRANSNTPTLATVRERQHSAPSAPPLNMTMPFGRHSQPAPRRSPAGTPPNMEASTAFENIGREDVVDPAALPSDWGRNAASRGWRGAPPAPPSNITSREQQDTPARPDMQKRSSWSFWGGSAQRSTSPPAAVLGAVSPSRLPYPGEPSKKDN